MNVTFLLGSGASVPAGFPTVSEVTDAVHAECVSPADAGPLRDPAADGGKRLLRWLEVQTKRRFGAEYERSLHYENLYFLAQQILDDVGVEFENAALRPFVESAIKQVLPSSSALRGDEHDELGQLANWFTLLIRRVVVKQIAGVKPTRLDHLDFVIDGMKTSGLHSSTILTLNHDILVEKILSENHIAFSDGFALEANAVGVRCWQPQILRMSVSVRLLKLHGGIDWYRFRPCGVQTFFEDYFGIPTPDYLERKCDSGGRLHDILNDDLPIFLIGAWDKLARYTDPVYLELYYAAFEALTLADVLVVVGYGFGDKGINKLVADWMCRSPGHRLVVVDRYADDLWRYARGAIAFKWGDWLEEKRLFPFQVDLKESKLEWPSIEAVLIHAGK